MEEKVDRRVIKTKERIREVFIDLLAEKPIKSITVKELSERADINRATFYLHYEDVFDLQARLEDDALEQFENVCSGLNVSFSDEEFTEAFIRLLEFIRSNGKFCTAHIGVNGDRSFFERLVKVVTDRCFDREQYTTYGFTFVLAGIVGIVLEWVFAGMQETPGIVASHVLTIIRKLQA
ncbi:MAG: TetR/AcrR family transcriptional regulator [Clostridia bacterium]|nr:TetR/AcrR family transcriptional regulator [Clostridia bacterium]MBR5427027.1 TetR/AcrR family transcriptional regulator [Clostridia bacterium]